MNSITFQIFLSDIKEFCKRFVLAIAFIFVVYICLELTLLVVWFEQKYADQLPITEIVNVVLSLILILTFGYEYSNSLKIRAKVKMAEETTKLSEISSA